MGKPGTKQSTRAEELANALTHGIGAGLAAAALAILVTFAALQGDAWRVVSFSIYGATLLALYLASTFYHAFRSPRLKRIFRLMDHAAIFLLIAGTYTPLTLVNLRGPWGWTMFGILWGLAIIGVVLTLVAMERLQVLLLCTYLAMGWMLIVAIKPVLEHISAGGLMWIAVGGVTYTLGVVFYLWHKLPFNHALWHLFVLGGSICHFFAMLFHVLPAAAD